ncbi:MAG TPA: retropepsin-like aspartic protease [Terracidiphilus sp.]|nr:retropepsin-like aspartic protease [Terracidiphilus sp.]HEV2323593.1 retropepsin-like aspartic protease [Terracidiphilus sp.]
MKSFLLNSSFALLLLTPSNVFAETLCPGSVTLVQYHLLQSSLIATSVNVNGSGPFEFMVDTGAQITVVDPALADDLKLKVNGSIGVVAFNSYEKVPLVSAAVVEAGPVAVHDLQMAVEGLEQLQAWNPKLRGVLGNNFLSRFDLLIDRGHKMLCFDDSRQMQRAVRGERVSLLVKASQPGEIVFTQPVLVSVHLPGDGRKGTVLRLDSGANVPILFVDRNADSLPWLQMNRMIRGSTVGNAARVSYAVTPVRAVKFTAHQQMQVAFFTPINAGQTFAKGGEDGLLPITLFKRVLISMTDHFVMFDPQS